MAMAGARRTPARRRDYLTRKAVTCHLSGQHLPSGQLVARPAPPTRRHYRIGHATLGVERLAGRQLDTFVHVLGVVAGVGVITRADEGEVELHRLVGDVRQRVANRDRVPELWRLVGGAHREPGQPELVLAGDRRRVDVEATGRRGGVAILVVAHGEDDDGDDGERGDSKRLGVSSSAWRRTRLAMLSGSSSARGIRAPSTRTGMTRTLRSKAASISRRTKSCGSSSRRRPRSSVMVSQRSPSTPPAHRRSRQLS